ncbi:caspase family protein [Lutibacter sp. A64]|uniref:caspase family protein n=1 Tax=Lutibacter sp. A64 TaxID=2918526 RepID=UPI001F0551A7|nr:caspase family protein [Lutibacter sp. A64]UMB54543.1 caspase family protein [Lutibacter sp. A64]
MKNVLILIVFLNLTISYSQTQNYSSYETSASFITIAGGIGQGDSENQLNIPSGIFVDDKENVYVADTYNHRIQMWTPGAKKGITVAGGKGRGNEANQLNRPSGIFVDIKGNIYVADTYNHRIQMWAPGAWNGITVAGGSQGSADDQFNLPYSIFISAQGEMFVSDAGNHRIQKWVLGERKGVTVAGGKGRGNKLNQLNRPFGLFLDTEENIYIADSFNHRIQKWAPGAREGITVAGGNESGNAANQLNMPTGVFVDEQYNIYIADNGNNRVQKWNLGAIEGITISVGNENDTSKSQFVSASSIFIDRIGNIYISNIKSHSVQKKYKRFDYTNLTKDRINFFIQNFVNEEMNNWNKKGEFEKSSSYQLRVSEANRKQKIKDLQQLAITKLENEYSKTVDFGSSILGSYDADNEVFTVKLGGFEEITINVKLEEAPLFKENWNEILKTKKFILTENGFELSSLNFYNPKTSKKYSYNYLQNKNVYAYENNNLKKEYNSSDKQGIGVDSELKKVDKKKEVIKSDVDINIPETTSKQMNTYALIIGNEDYKSKQSGLTLEQNVDFAENDADVFALYCKKTLGIPNKQVKILKNATAAEIRQGLAWINNLSDIENGNAKIIFYYSGHGLPDQQTKEPYLIPVDVSGTHLDYAIKLSDVYKSLTEFPAQQITVFLDACFSGGARNQGLLAMKGIKVKAMKNIVFGNIVVFSSSSGIESSAVYREKQHGYFTYFLLKKLKETEGKVDYNNLSRFIKYSVRKEVGLKGIIQTPQVNVGIEVENEWMLWKLK